MKIFGGILVLAFIYAVLALFLNSTGLMPNWTDEETDHIESTQMLIH